ncbi:MAG: hypothetical protein JWP26_554 [Devosia sp.]|nr:hypothetical protein [Devosia sp.]
MRGDALIRRARRSAKSIVGGDELLHLLLTPNFITMMKAAVPLEIPPVANISRALKAFDFGEKVDLHALSVRQFIGTAVKAIMVTQGFELMETGVKIAGDPVFRSGATYQKADALLDAEDDDDLLSRFVAALNASELVRLKDLVDAAL